MHADGSVKVQLERDTAFVGYRTHEK